MKEQTRDYLFSKFRLLLETGDHKKAIAMALLFEDEIPMMVDMTEAHDAKGEWPLFIGINGFHEVTLHNDRRDLCCLIEDNMEYMYDSEMTALAQLLGTSHEAEEGLSKEETEELKAKLETLHWNDLVTIFAKHAPHDSNKPHTLVWDITSMRDLLSK